MGAMLRDVSRSFYLSIRALPGGLREPVGLGRTCWRGRRTPSRTRRCSGPTTACVSSCSSARSSRTALRPRPSARSSTATRRGRPPS